MHSERNVWRNNTASSSHDLSAEEGSRALPPTAFSFPTSNGASGSGTTSHSGATSGGGGGGGNGGVSSSSATLQPQAPHHRPTPSATLLSVLPASPVVVGGSGDGSVGNAPDAAYRSNAVDRSCWLYFRAAVAMCCTAAVALCVGRFNFEGRIPPYSKEYFALCFIGGAISGLPHVLITPLDLLKCRMQVGEYTSIREGIVLLRREAATAGATSTAAWLDALFRGWAPTVVGYVVQGSAKYGFYELFKYFLALHVSYEFANAHMSLVFIAAAGLAEFVADTLLAPWEAVKIRMQTTRQYPPMLSIMLPRIWALEGVRGFYKSLPALWTRQIPYTIVKFYSFELIVRLLLKLYSVATATHPSGGTLMALTLLGGALAGMLCALVSHPADTIVAKLNQRGDSRHGLFSLLQSLSCRDIWKGLGLRLCMVGFLTALQWFCYDGFRFAAGLGTTGRSAPR